MKTGRLFGLVLLLGFAPTVACPAKKLPISVSQLKSILAKQGFSGTVRGDVHFSNFGILPCGSNRYQVFYYEWYESHPPGLAIHAQYRVLFIRNDNSYVGSYVVQDRPMRISGNSLIFEYPGNLGNRIQCDADGLPANILLNDEGGTLFK